MRKLMATLAAAIGLAASAATLDLSTVTADTKITDGTTVTGKLSKKVTLTIADEATVTLSGVSINSSGSDDSSCPWAGLTCVGSATIVLKGDNTVWGFCEGYPGIRVPPAATLTIEGDGGTLYVYGGGKAAGIGAGSTSVLADFYGCGGNVVINGGTVEAYGGGGAAGIGSGYGTVSGNIVINGNASVYAYGGGNAAGIGTGYFGCCGSIVINGGWVSGEGGDGAAGIGSGLGGRCGCILIDDGFSTIFATAGDTTADPIGKGALGTCDAVKKGQNVKVSAEYASGGKSVCNLNSPVVNLDTVTENTTFYDGEILTGTLAANVKVSIADGATVTLRDVTINGVDKWYEWAGITCEGDATIILEGKNTVKGFYENYPGISVPEGYTLTIKGDGSLDASSNGYGAGIGGGYNLSCGNIRIEGGTVNATGGKMAAGIGGGCAAACGDITITKVVTSVTAVRWSTDDTYSSGRYSIGSGLYGGTVGTVTIGGVVGEITESPYTYKGQRVDMSALSGSYTAADGDVLYGETAHKVTVPIGATAVIGGVEVSGGLPVPGTKFTLTRNPNGGTYQGKTEATVSTGALAYGAGNYWDIGAPTRSGFTCTGWFTAATGGEMVYDASGKCVAGRFWDSAKHYVNPGDLAVYAQWAQAKYTLTRDPNGGTYQGKTTAIVSANALTYGSGAYWDIGAPTLSGSTFVGWFTAKTGGAMVYDASGKCVAGTAYWDSAKHYCNNGSLTVYAQWVGPGSKFTLTRNPNGGTYQGKTEAIVSPDALVYGGGNYWDIGSATRSGYVFGGWWTAASGGEMVYDWSGKCVPGRFWDSSKHYINPGVLLVYARWVAAGAKYSLTRDPNGGTYNGKTTATVAANALSYDAGAYWSIGVPARSGYTFLGWFTAKTGGVKVYDAEGKCVAGSYWTSDKHYRYAGDLVVYAQWAKKSSQVVEGNNGKWKMENGELAAAPLPEWAVGTFEGAVLDAEASGVAGAVTLTVAADGSVSGKMLEGGRTWTLSAPALEYAGGAYIAAVTGRCGELSFTGEATFAADDMQRGVASCKATSASPAWTAWQDIWKAEPWQTAAKSFADAPALAAPGGVSLRFASTGAVTAKLGARSCSSTLIPAADGTFSCFLYFPPKGSFGGYAAEVPLAWNGAEFSLAE